MLFYRPISKTGIFAHHDGGLKIPVFHLASGELLLIHPAMNWAVPAQIPNSRWILQTTTKPALFAAALRLQTTPSRRLQAGQPPRPAIPAAAGSFLKSRCFPAGGMNSLPPSRWPHTGQVVPSRGIPHLGQRFFVCTETSSFTEDIPPSDILLCQYTISPRPVKEKSCELVHKSANIKHDNIPLMFILFICYSQNACKSVKIKL